MFWFIQANCGRGRAATLELAVRLRESGCLFALLQEPYIGSGTSDVLPEGMRIYTDRIQKAAILVDHQDVICMPKEPLTTDYGVFLFAETPMGLQKLLDTTVCFLSSVGLTLNTDKCFTVSIKGQAKQKCTVVERRSFLIGGRECPSLKRTDEWKYLGIKFTAEGRARYDP
ncbi:hypothetical protein KR067_002597, partial [Drosophila pandora]